QGLATSIGIGTATITTTSGTVSGGTALSVTVAALTSVVVTPAIPSIPLGTSQQFTATGTFTDKTTQDLTSTAQWSSSQAAVATIDNSGVATGGSTGITTISVTSGSITGTTTLTVTAAVLNAITVNPTVASIPLGTTQQFTASGSFSDGSTQDVTGTVHWSSSDGTVATVSITAGSQGLASTLASGAVTITAASGSVSGSGNLTVTAATLVSIALTPQNPAIPLGTSQQFAATG